MYSTKEFFKQKVNNSPGSLYDYLDPYAIFAKYIGSFLIGRAYNSPLREDKSASFAVFVDKRTGMLLYKDMGTGDCGDAIKFVKRMFNLKSTKEAVSQIKKDFLLEDNTSKLESRRIYSHKRVEIRISSRQWEKADLAYWHSFGITYATLKRFNVIPIKSYYSDGVLKYVRTGNELAYAYKVFSNYRIYRPLSSKNDKWRGDLSKLDIFGYEQLTRKGQIVILTKSLKDLMSLTEMGYNAIAPPSESSTIEDVVIKDLEMRFNKIIIFYDRDKAGMKYTRSLFQKTGWDFFFMPKYSKAKDISDYIKENGFDSGKKLIDSIIKKKMQGLG